MIEGKGTAGNGLLLNQTHFGGVLTIDTQTTTLTNNSYERGCDWVKQPLVDLKANTNNLKGDVNRIVGINTLCSRCKHPASVENFQHLLFAQGTRERDGIYEIMRKTLNVNEYTSWKKKMQRKKYCS